MSLRDNTRGKAADEEASAIDLTPMLDVVFIMLIFFIVTSSFIKEPGVEIFKPQAKTTEACPNGTIIFAIDKAGKINYNKNVVTLARAKSLAESAKKEAPRAQVVIQMDESAQAYFGEELYDELREIMTEPPCISTDDEA